MTNCFRFDDVPVISTKGRNLKVSPKIPLVGRNDSTFMIIYMENKFTVPAFVSGL